MQIYAEAKNNDTWAKMSVYMGTQFKNTAYENVSCWKDPTSTLDRLTKTQFTIY